MEILRFTLSGKQAFFKNPEVNAYNYYTFGHIHKVALMGMIGAIMGYGGYNQMKPEDEFPEFYKKLKDICISVVPICKKGRFNRKIVTFNNSTGAGSEEHGGNLIIRQQWLEEPKWNIYILLDNEESKSIAQKVLKHQNVYTPYLGSNDHLANIEEAEVISGETIQNPEYIDSLYLKKHVEMDVDDFDKVYFKYEETLPIALDNDLNMYQYEKFAFSDMKVIKSEGEIYSIEDRYYNKNDRHLNIMFF